MNKEDIDGQIFVRNAFTDFENLLFAKNRIKELEKELKDTKIKYGKLQSEYDEFIDIQGFNPKSIKESISALRSENRRLKKALTLSSISITEELRPILSNKAWKVRYDKLFQEYIILKNNKDERNNNKI